ncbi:MAG: hypothetical protein J6X66_11965 [Lachnospiraceae bacterium]|nr:hypothetical protein [Lachnospiraceae bacterium]
MSAEKKATGVNRSLSNVIFPLLLFLFALIGADQGTDLSDTMYAAANYAFFKTDTGSWHFATFLANLTGHFFYVIGGGRLIWLKLLCSLIPAFTAVLVYFLLKDRIHQYFLFPALLAALGLCWSPSVILYQHLSYLALTAGSLLLYKAMTKRDRRIMAFAGLVIGLGLFVRVSNLTHCALIFYVIYEDIRSKETKKLPADILCCIGGYAAGAAAGLLFMLISGGTDGFLRMVSWIRDLLGGSSGEGGYTLWDMLSQTADNYFGNLFFVLLAVSGIIAGSLMFRLLKDRLKIPARILYCTGIILLFIYYYRNGVFDTKYYNVGSIFRISVVMLIFLLALDIWVLVDSKFRPEEKGLALLALISQLMIPLGSNNHLYSCINDMYFLMPVGIHLFAGLIHVRGNKKSWSFPLVSMGLALFLLLLIQSSMFHFSFAFKDGVDGTKRNVRIGDEGAQKLKGMKTSGENAAAIKGICDAAQAAGGEWLLTYGDIPGFNYILDLKPPISTAWPDLESYREDRYGEELSMVSGRGICIMTKEAADLPDHEADKKLLYLREFLYNNDYERSYDGDVFVLFERRAL